MKRWISWLYSITLFLGRFSRPVRIGAHALVLRDESVLLVQLSYRKGWYLPGGGVNRGESCYDAVVREMREECGIEAQNPQLMGLYLNRYRGYIDHNAVFIIREFSGEARAADTLEIVDARFFPLSELPPDVASGHRRRIEELKGERQITPHW